MGSLIKADFYKLFRQKSFYVSFIILAIMATIVTFTINFSINMMQQTEEYEERLSNLTASGMLKKTFERNAILLVAILIPLFVTSEFRSGTIKNIISRGCNRSKIFFSKLIVSIIFAVGMLLIYSIIATLIGTTIWGFGATDAAYWQDFMQFLGLQVCLNIAYVSVFVMISFLFNSTGAAIAICICITQFSSMITSLIQMLLYQVTNKSYSVSNGLISTNIAELISEDLSSGLITRSLIVAIVYSIISIILGLLFFKRKDIK